MERDSLAMEATSLSRSESEHHGAMLVAAVGAAGDSTSIMRRGETAPSLPEYPGEDPLTHLATQSMERVRRDAARQR